ncbi:MAG: holo-ACP synthase [Gammaproteobacteria bacterium]|nr:holo-ACP synthase [Gammaproteobacteria bacterium]
MIHGIGTDIVHIPRIAAALQRFGDRFAKRILNQKEIRELADVNRKDVFLAKRFAIKEAAAKAMGTGFRKGVTMCDISLDHDVLGRPILSFHGVAGRMLAELGIGDAHVSVSDEREYALAFVTLVKNGTFSRPDTSHMDVCSNQ